MAETRVTADLLVDGATLIPLSGKIPISNVWQTHTYFRAEARSALIRGHRGNLGFPTGMNRVEMPDGTFTGVQILDEDVKPGQKGRETLARLEQELGPLPPTLTVRTASGGRHFYFEALPELERVSPKPFVSDFGKDAGLDFLRNGQQAVFPGSELPSGKYEWLDTSVPVARLPDGWVQYLKLHVKHIHTSVREDAPEPVDVTTENGKGLVLEGIEWCEKEAPVAVKGNRGQDDCLRVAAHLVKVLRLPLDVAKDIMVHHWAPRCDPPNAWSDWNLTRKLEQARDVVEFPAWGLPISEESARAIWAPGRARKKADKLGISVEEVLALPDDVERVEIITGSDLFRVVEEASVLLGNHPRLYQRGGKLARVVRLGDTRRRSKLTEGTAVILPVQDATLKTELTFVGDWKAWKVKTQNEIAEAVAEAELLESKAISREEKETARKNIEVARADKCKLVPTTPPDDVVSTVQARGCWPVPALAGVTESPAMRPDGTILQVPGYDEDTGFYFDPGTVTFPHIDKNPTQEQAHMALQALEDVFSDFPYVGAGKYVSIAAILTMLARPAIDGNVPCFLFDASTPGSGKTLQAEIVAMLVTGRKVSKTTYPSSMEELDKVLAGYAVAGTPLFCFDNISTPFGGAPLDKVTTSNGSVSLRVLGRTGNSSFDWRSVIMGTGNNFSYQGDMSRRVIVSRLEPGVENPENRTATVHPERWGEDKLFTWLLANRPALVASGLTILRAYVAAGKPAQPGVQIWGSFAAWTRLVASSIVWAGGEDPQLARPAPEDAGDPQKDAMSTIFAGWPDMSKCWTTGELLNVKGCVEERFSTGDVDFASAVSVLVPPKFGTDQKAALGYVFRRWAGRVVDGKKLVLHRDANRKVNTWQLVAAPQE